VSNVISTLKGVEGLSTGRLYSAACPGSSVPRSDFENLLRSLAKADLIALSEHAFEKEGKSIHYKRAELTEKGYDIDLQDIRSLAITSRAGTKRRKGKMRIPTRKPATATAIRGSGGGASENQELIDTLSEWRKRMARKRGLPAFRILTNRVLASLASELPTSDDELYLVQGVGPFFVEKYGKEIIRMVKEFLNQSE
jgi:superfamily II DNA helicase RecQ